MSADHSSVPPHLTEDERAELAAAKARYEQSGDRTYLAVLVEMRARSAKRMFAEACHAA